MKPTTLRDFRQGGRLIGERLLPGDPLPGSVRQSLSPATPGLPVGASAATVRNRAAAVMVTEDSADRLLAHIADNGWPADSRSQVLGVDGKRYSGSNYWYPELLNDVVVGPRSEH